MQRTDSVHLENELPTAEEAYAVDSIELASGVAHGVTDEDLAAVLPHCEYLRGLDLRGLPDLSERTLFVLARNHYVDLRYLDLSNCTQDINAGLCELIGQNLRIQVLRLNRVAGLTDATVTFAARSLAWLVDFEIADQPLVTAASLRDVWSLSKQLKKLVLRGCTHVTDKGFPSPFGEPPREAASHVASIPLDSQRAQAKLKRRAALGHRSQTSESYSRVSSWLNEGMSPLVLPNNHELKHLRELDLCYCKLITDTAISGIVSHAPHIRKLYVAGCSNLTDMSLKSLRRLGPTLESINLAHVDQITDEGFLAFVRACPSLKYVDIGFCKKLTDLAVLELAELDLHHLSIAAIPSVSDISIKFLADHAPDLTHLHISQCKNISLDAVHFLLRRCKHLKFLSASGMRAMTRMGVKNFSEPIPPGYDPSNKSLGCYRVFRGDSISRLRAFLDKEETRRRAAEEAGIPFIPREDDSLDLY